MIKTTFLKTGKRAIKTTVLLTVFAVFSALGQTVPIDPPTGGLAIDGDLESNSPTAGVGDWVQGVAGTGGFVINNDGTVVDPTFTLFVSDAYNSGADNVFTGGSKSFQSPADWVWTNSNAIGKGDMHRAMYQLGVENPGTASAQDWITIASDRRSTTGTSYIDFELYQKTVETTNTGGFITLGTEGGRTENDILLTIEYGSGGSVATVFFYLWKEVSPGNWDYVLQSTTSGNAFARTNSGTISMPIGSFGTPNYTARQFIEGAINLTDVFGSTSDPCIGVSFSTLLIKTKASNSRTASLNDFVEPIQVEIQFGTADIEYASTSVCESDDNITPTITGITGGTFSSSPAGLDLNTTTGEVNVANSDPGTYTITYTYVTNGCTKTAQTTLTIYENPDAPVFVENITECEADPIQTLDANDGITVPTGVSVVWYSEATGGVSVMNPTLSAVGNAIYYAEAVDDTTGCTSDTRTPVSLMILAAPDAPTSSGNITECEESPIQTLDANDAISSLPDFTVLLWYDAASGGSVVSDPTLSTVGSETYYAASVNSQTGCVSLTRTAVTLTINPAPDAPVSSGDITECEADPIQTLNANDAIVTSLTEAAPSPDFSTGGTASLVSVVWYDAATGGSVVANPILNAVGSVTYYAENTDSVTGCSSLTRTAVTLTIEPAPDAPVSSGDIIECEASPIQTLDANDAISVPGSVGYIWYDAATGGSVVAAADAVLSAIGSVTYYAEAVDATTGCTSLNRTAVTLTIQAAPDAPVSSGDITECEASPIQTLDANDAISVPGSVGYIWYDAATGGSVVAAADAVLNAFGSVTYYAEAVDATTGCTSLTRTAVTLTIEPAPDAPVSSGDITECEASPIQTLDANDAISVPGSVGYIWYDAATGGSVVTDPTLSAVGSVTFYAEAIDSVTGCISLTRTAVTLTIQAAPDAPVSSGDITECEASPIQTLDANDAISVPGSVGYIWYDAATGGSVVTDPTLSAVGSVTFYAEAIDSVTGCTSLTRTAVTLTIEPAPDAPVSSGDITECEEDPIQTLDANDAITVAAGTTVVWYDAATGGSVVADPTLSAVGSVTYYAEAVADGTDCSSLTRTAVTLTIEPAPDAPVSSGDITECEEDPIQTLDANDAITVAAGTTVVWYDAATGGSVVADPTLSAVGSVTYYAEAVADGTDCSSLTRTAVTLTIEPAPDAPVSSGDITECEEDPIQTLDANDAITVAAGTTVVWYDAATGGSVVADPTLSAVGSVTYYAEAVADGTDCSSLTRTAVTLTIEPAPDAPVSSGDITECEEDPIQTLDANDAITVAAGTTVVWYDAATGGSVVADPTLSAVGSVTYYAEAVADGTDCSSLTRTAVTLTIEPAPAAPISAGDITECEEDPIQTLDANDAITVSAGTTVVWYDAATGGSVVADPTLSAVGSVTYYAEAVADGTDCSSLTRTAVTLTIEPAPDAPASLGDITECEEDPIQTLDANDAMTVAAGTTVVWYDAATGGSVVADPTLSAVGSVTYYAEAVADGTDCSSLTRTAVTLTIEPAPDAPVSSGDITECEEDPIQTLDANDAITVAAGTTVVWYDAATGGSVVADPTLSAVGSVTYYAEAVADGTDCSSLTRTAVTLTIEPAPDAPVSSGDITECEEDPIQTLDANDAITVAAGTTVVWYDAATGGSVVADPTLSAVGSVTYYAEAVADGTDCSSLTRTAVTLTIEPAPDAPVSSGDITECEEDPIQTLDANDAITVAAGTTVVWYDAATGGSVVADPTLSAVGSVTYYAEAVADGTDCSSLTRTAVTLTIEPAPDAPVSSGDITECEEDPIQTLDANDAITVAAGTTVVWYDAATGGSVVADPTLSAVGSVTYYAEAVADGTDCSSLTRTAVTLTIEPAPDAPVSSGDITECEEDPIQTLDANDAITVAAGTTVVWYDAATGGSVVISPTLNMVGSVTYYAEAVADGTDCSSLTRTAVTLTIEPAPAAPISAGDITECEADPIQTLDANDAITVAAGTTVVWYDAATGGSVVADPTLSAVGSVTYYAEAVADGTDCSSLTRTAVTLTIQTSLDPPVSSGDITECEEDPIQTLDANDAITLPIGISVVWYDAASGGAVVANPILNAVGSVTYYAEAVDSSNGCISLTRTAVTLTIEPAPDAPVSSGDITECEEDPIQTLDANDAITVAAGTTVVWYDAATGGSVVADPTLSAVGSVTYYAEAVADGTDCSSLTRTAVTLTIEPAPDAPVSSGDITECEEDPIQTLDANDAITVAAGTTVVWYDAATGGSVVADPTLSAVGSVTYYAEAVADGTDCSSLTRTAVTLTIEPAPDAPVSSGDITECEEDPIQTLDANDAITVAAGTTVVWYDAATGGSVVADPTLSAVGSVTYYAEAVADGTDCSSLTRTAVTLTIEPAPDAPVSSGDITECEEDPIQTLDANDAITVAAGTTVVWYDAATGGSVVADPTLSAVGSVTYYAEAVADGTDCSSLTRTAVTLTIEPAPDAPVSSGDITECEEDPIQTLDANDAITVAAGTTVVWYDAATGGSVVADPTLSAVGSVTYYAEAVADGTDCSSLTRTAVTLTILEAPDAPVSSGDITECEEDPIQTLDANDAIVPGLYDIVWYDAATGGSVVANPILNTLGSVTYYAESVDPQTGCSSLTRTAVTLTLLTAPDAPVSSGDITECEEDPIQTLDANDAITVAAGTTVVWYDAATGGSVVANPTLNAVGSVTYYAEAVAGGSDCVSLERTSVTLTIEPAPDAPVSSGDITECEEDPIQTLDANDAITVAAGTTVVWYDAATGGSVVADPTLSAVGSVTYYAEAVADGTDCSSLTRTAVTLTIEPAPDAPVSSGDITECEEDPIQTLDANDAITVAAGTTVVWYDAATGGLVVADPTLSAVGSVTYYAEAVADGTDCSSLTRTAVTLTIEPAPDAPVSSGDITECEEDPIQTLDANDAITVAAGTTVVWYDAAMGGSVVADPTLSAVGSVTYYAEAVADGTDCSSLTRTAVTLTIEPAPDAPVSSGDITECEEDPIQTLDANDAITVAAGTTVVWYDAATGGSVVADPTLSAVGSVTYYAEAVADGTDCSSLTRTAVTLTIEPAPDAPVSSGDITECEEDPIQTLDANDAITVAAGTTVVWYDAATGGSVVADPTLSAVGSVTYYAEAVADGTDCSSLTRTAVTLTIEPAPDAPVSSGDITECEEDPIQTLDANDAITVAAGTTVVWYDAATGGSVVTDPTLSAVGSVTYYAEAVADGTDCSSLTRTAVTLTIEPAPDAPVSSGDITECEEDPIQTLNANDAITVAAGTTVVWYDAATGGSVVADPTLSAVGSVTYYAEAVADGTDCSSLIRTAVTLTIEPAPDAPVSSGDITECEEDPIQTLDANDAITIAAGTTVVWYDAATGGSVVADPTLSAVGSVTYYAEAVADGTDCSSLTRTAVTLTIEPAPDAPVSSGDITECEEDPIQTLDANDAITVAAGTTVVWYDAATGGSVVADPTLSAVGSVTYYAEAVADGTDCSSLTRTAVTLTIEPAPDAPVSSGDITECEEDPIQTLNANDAITVVAGTEIVWYDAATGGSIVDNPILDTVGTVTYYAEAVDKVTGCTSLSRTAVTLTILAAPDAPVSSGDITECEEDPIQTLDANDAITVGAGESVVWYDAATGGTVVADPTLSTVGSVTYYAETVDDATGCTSLERTAVTLTIQPAPDAPVSSGDITECALDPIQILNANDAITIAAGTEVVWYDAATGGAVVDNPILNAIGSVTYYVESVDKETGCTSNSRTAVTLTINDCNIALLKEGVFVDGNGSGCADEGELIEYTFTIVNTGNVPLSDVVLLDPFLGGEIPGPDSGDDNGNGLLDPDEVWIYTATYAVTLDDLNNGFVINQAEVFANGPDGLEVSDLSDPVNLDADDPTETELCQEAQFSLEKIGVFNDENGDGQPQVGETITYTFIVTNTGTVTIFGLTIEDPLPGLEVTGGPIDLPPGAVDDTTFTATYTLTEEDIENGEVRNQAFGVGTDGNGNEVRDDSDDPNDPTDDDNNGDGEPDDVTVTVLPDVLGVEFEIFNGVTPDGDGLNDFFRVLGIENFPDNNMQIFNRWGVLVYETDGYGGSDGETNVFRGRSEGRVTVRESKLLPTGTYYYVLRRFVDGETLTNSGYLYVNRK